MAVVSRPPRLAPWTAAGHGHGHERLHQVAGLVFPQGVRELREAIPETSRSRIAMNYRQQPPGTPAPPPPVYQWNDNNGPALPLVIPGSLPRKFWAAEAKRENLPFSNILIAAQELKMLSYTVGDTEFWISSADALDAAVEDVDLPILTRIRIEPHKLN